MKEGTLEAIGFLACFPITILIVWLVLKMTKKGNLERKRKGDAQIRLGMRRLKQSFKETGEFINNDPQTQEKILRAVSAVGDFMSGKLEEFEHKTAMNRSKRLSELVALEHEIEQQKTKLRLYKELDNKNVEDSEAMLLTLFNPKKTASSSSSQFGIDGMNSNATATAEYGAPAEIMQIKQQNKLLDTLIEERLVGLKEMEEKIKGLKAQTKQEESKARIAEIDARTAEADFENTPR